MLYCKRALCNCFILYVLCHDTFKTMYNVYLFLSVLLLYVLLDGYPASLGFPIMHRVHAICTHAIIVIT